MNAVPEWFTVEPDETHRYNVQEADGSSRLVSGKVLSAGLPLRIEPGKSIQLVVRPER